MILKATALFYHILFLGLLCGCAFILPTPVSAQVNLGNSASLEIEPRYPTPGSTFTARFALYGDSISSLSWTVNGETIAGTPGNNTISLTAPDTLGESVRIVARAQTRSGPATLEQTVTMGAVDIITEGDTIAPYFYEGRRVPGTGAAATLIAVPHLYTSGGSKYDAQNLTYIWSLNDTIIASGKGVTHVTLPAQTLSVPVVRLTVKASTGAIIYDTALTVTNAEPEMAFYPLSPLYGLSRNAVQDAYLQIATEATVRAEPYFVERNVFSNAEYGWKVNGDEVDNQSSDPRLITLRSNVKGSFSDIEFAVRSLRALSQHAIGVFRINFN